MYKEIETLCKYFYDKTTPNYCLACSGEEWRGGEGGEGREGEREQEKGKRVVGGGIYIPSSLLWDNKLT